MAPRSSRLARHQCYRPNADKAETHSTCSEVGRRNTHCTSTGTTTTGGGCTQCLPRQQHLPLRRSTVTNLRNGQPKHRHQHAQQITSKAPSVTPSHEAQESPPSMSLPVDLNQNHNRMWRYKCLKQCVRRALHFKIKSDSHRGCPRVNQRCNLAAMATAALRGAAAVADSPSLPQRPRRPIDAAAQTTAWMPTTWAGAWPRCGYACGAADRRLRDSAP